MQQVIDSKKEYWNPALLSVLDESDVDKKNEAGLISPSWGKECIRASTTEAKPWSGNIHTYRFG